MLDERQRDALRQWYRRDAIREEAQRLVRNEDWESLEEFIQMRALFPLSRHDELPPYLRSESGPLIPSNCNPGTDVEVWRDAVEIGWEVVEETLGISRDEIHIRIKTWQERSWETFLRSVDDRMQRRDPPVG